MTVKKRNQKIELTNDSLNTTINIVVDLNQARDYDGGLAVQLTDSQSKRVNMAFSRTHLPFNIRSVGQDQQTGKDILAVSVENYYEECPLTRTEVLSALSSGWEEIPK